MTIDVPNSLSFPVFWMEWPGQAVHVFLAANSQRFIQWNVKFQDNFM